MTYAIPAYIIIVIILWGWLIQKAENKVYTGLISFWLLSFPILNRPEFMIHTPWGFDLQPTRIFLILSSIFLSISFVQNNLYKGLKPKKHPIRFFEISLFLYIIISTVVIIFKSDGLQQLIPLISTQIVFGLMYIIARDHIKDKDFSLVKTLFIIFGILSVITAIIQFFLDPNFMRLSSERIAYGNMIRANGFMPDEFDQGIFLTFLSVWVLLSEKINEKNFYLVCAYGLGIFLTMHRGSWLAFCMVMVIIAALKFNHYKSRYFLLSYIAFTLGVIIFLLITNLNSKNFLSPDFIYQQLFRDTLTTRMDLNTFGLKIMQKYPFGLGDYSFKSYWQAYFENGLKDYMGHPLIIHNGFVGAGVKYGIIGATSFILFILGVFYSGFRRMKNQKLITISTLCCFAFVIINMTQDFSNLASVPQLSLAFILGFSLKS